jgi:hypothetical protein
MVLVNDQHDQVRIIHKSGELLVPLPEAFVHVIWSLHEREPPSNRSANTGASKQMLLLQSFYNTSSHLLRYVVLKYPQFSLNKPMPTIFAEMFQRLFLIISCGVIMRTGTLPGATNRKHTISAQSFLTGHQIAVPL